MLKLAKTDFLLSYVHKTILIHILYFIKICLGSYTIRRIHVISEIVTKIKIIMELCFQSQMLQILYGPVSWGC